MRNLRKLLGDTTNKNVFIFENNPNNPIISPLYVKWLALGQIGKRDRGRNVLWRYECPGASAAVKTSNEAFGPHLALLTIGRIFLQKISYLMCSTGYHFDCGILASTCCWNWRSTFSMAQCPFHRWAQVLAWHRENIVITFKC